MNFDSKDPASRLAKQLNCPACYGASEEYFANGYTCPTCGRKESMFLKAFNHHQNRTLTNEGMNRIGDTIADLRMEVARLRKIEAAAVAAVEYEQWQGSTWYDLMIDLQKALHESIVGADTTGDKTS